MNEPQSGDREGPPPFTPPASARGWIDHLLRPGWKPLFDGIVSTDPLGFPGYKEQLARARERTGCSEAVLVAEGTIGRAERSRYECILVAFEFGFLGGSMGVATGERICRAFERGAEQGKPVIALIATGGARMQEGMLALAQMPATLVAREKLAARGVPFIAYLMDPTTGGVYASFASTADLIWAAPGATIGFAGPRVAETFTGSSLPEGSHTAEAAWNAGLVDQIVEEGDLEAFLVLALGWTSPGHRGAPRPKPPTAPSRSLPAWDQVRSARDPSRGHADYVRFTFVFGNRPMGGIHAGLCPLAGGSAVAIANAPRRQPWAGNPSGEGVPVHAQDYAVVRRAIDTAERLQLPIVTFVDTPGADPGVDSERAGVAREIARTFEALLHTRVPTVACVIGEGGSGGALALAACDRLLILDTAFFSVIAPEAAARILKRDDVETVADHLKLTPHDLFDAGLADLVVPDVQPEDALRRTPLLDAIEWAFGDIEAEGGAPTARRFDRWRALGRTL